MLDDQREPQSSKMGLLLSQFLGSWNQACVVFVYRSTRSMDSEVFGNPKWSIRQSNSTTSPKVRHGRTRNGYTRELSSSDPQYLAVNASL